MCGVVLLVLLVLLLGQALAEIPQTREIKDWFMWGDPDCPWSRARGLRDMAVGDPERGDPDNRESTGVSISIGPAGMRVGPVREPRYSQNLMTMGWLTIGAHAGRQPNSLPKQ
jgi:hypothetical protein